MANLPSGIDSREVIIGGGVHAMIYAATRRACGFPRPLVLEKTPVVGGVFGQYNSFWLNSVNSAGIASTRRGPSRMRPLSDVDDLNWFPNCRLQVKDEVTTEYPSSAIVAQVVRANLTRDADIVYGADVRLMDDPATGVFTVDGTEYRAGRVIDARGLSMPSVPGAVAGTPVLTADSFLRGQLPAGIRDGEPKRVALIGDGDTSYIVAESLLGQSPAGWPFRVSQIAWYGPTLPATKKQFASNVHARYMGLSRHMPQAGETGMVAVYNSRGDAVTLGASAQVNGQNYDLAVLCTGFRTAFKDDEYISAPEQVTQGRGLWRQLPDRYFIIGAAADIGFRGSEYTRFGEYGEGYTRFPRNIASIFRLAPETARLAASLPAAADAGGA